MKHGTSISLSDEDLEKLSYISDCLGFINTTGGVTGLIRICIQKAYAHQLEIEQGIKEREQNRIKPNDAEYEHQESCLPVGGISQVDKIPKEKKRRW